MQLRSVRVTALVAASLVFGVVSAGAASAGSTPTRTPVSTELVAMTATSSYVPPSPDPMGITYVPWTNHLLITDSEVEEIPGLYTGMNLFETTLDGTLVRTGTTDPWSIEPTDVTVDAATHRYFFADDDGDKVWIIADGPDHLIGNSDDVRTSFSTRPFIATDIEGIAFAGGDLYVADGVSAEVYRVTPGPNGLFDGVAPAGDDTVTSFDVLAGGQSDPEGVEYNPARGTLSVISNVRRSPISEYALDGTLLGTIDMSAIDIRHASGLTFGPGSLDASRTSAYITDRGVDNNFDPTENDGKLYEIRVASTPNEAPQITDPGNQSDVEGASVSLQIDATDADGDPMTYAATGLPNGLSIGVTTGLISGTVAAGAHLGSPFTTDVGVGDGQAIAHVLLTWTVTDTDTTAPAMPTALKIRATTRGLQLNWAHGPEADVAGYEVSRASSPGGPYTELTGAPITSSAFRDNAAPPGATSYYWVTALDDSGNVSAPAQRGAARGTIVFHGSSKLSKHAVAITLHRPAAAQTGDLLVATIVGSGSRTITPPAGWTPASSKSSPLHLRESVFTHVVAGGDGATSTFSLGANARSVVGVMVAYAGVDTAGPVDVAAGQVNASSTKIVAPSLSPTVTQEVLVGSFGIANGATIKPPMGMFPGGYKALRTWQRKVAVLVADQVMPTTNVTGRRTAKASAAAVNAGIALLLTPAP